MCCPEASTCRRASPLAASADRVAAVSPGFETGQRPYPVGLVDAAPTSRSGEAQVPPGGQAHAKKDLTIVLRFHIFGRHEYLSRVPAAAKLFLRQGSHPKCVVLSCNTFTNFPLAVESQIPFGSAKTVVEPIGCGHLCAKP